MPRSFSIAIQSEVAWRAALRDFTEPAIWIAPPNSSSFSVRVVLPASGCEMIANVRRRWVSFRSVMVSQCGRELSDALGPEPRQILLAVIPAKAGIHLDLFYSKQNGFPLSRE